MRHKEHFIMMVYIYVLWSFVYFLKADAAYSTTDDKSIRTNTVGAATYDAVSRPDAQTAVKVGLSILAIDSLDLKNQQFSAAGWLTFEWTDSRLTWVPATYGNIESTFVSPSTIWKPELLIDNSLDNLGVIADSNLHLRVTYDGTVEWEPPELFETHCEVDIAYYPYDRQKCGIEIVSWGYTVDEVKLEQLADVNLDDFVNHGEWLIDKTAITINNISETTSSGVIRTHNRLIFGVYLVRRTEFYDMNVMIPIVLTSLLVILVFVVPVDSGEKLSYVLTVFLSLAVLLTLVSDALPSTSITPSVLGLYLAFVLVLAGVACFLTVIVMIWFHKEGSVTNPSKSMSFVRGMAKVSCSKQLVQSSSETTLNKVVPAEEVTENGNQTRNDVISYYDDVTWRDAAIVMDRFWFVVFSIMTLVTNVSFILALVIGGATNEP